MHITVLDGHTLNPGDLSWETLERLGACSIYERTPPADTVERALPAEIVLTNKTVLDRAILAQLPRLRYIGVHATGYNVVDVKAAREHGVVVTNVPRYGTDSVAQMVFAHILNLTQRVAHHARTVRTGRWTAAEDFCYWDFPLLELRDRTLGIVGYGRIGRAVADIALAFGMKVLACGTTPGNAVAGVQWCDSIDELLPQVDFLSLHCPLTNENRNMMNAERLAAMKPGAFLINTSRGPLIDEQALAEALNHGRLAGAGLDVLTSEPPPPENPLLAAVNCFITPHIAWATRAARKRLLQTAVANVEAFLRGTPRNEVTKG
jgi:glycerate dehydrogenase